MPTKFLFPAGQAAILSVLMIFVLGFLTVDGVSSLTIRHRRITTDIVTGLQSYYAAESGIEDAMLRNLNSEMLFSEQSFTLGETTVTTDVVDENNTITITTAADTNNRTRKMRAVLSLATSSADFSAGLQSGEGGIDINNNATVSGDVYSGGDIVGNATTISGNLTVVDGLSAKWQLSGVPESATQSFTFANNVTSRRDTAQSFVISGQSGLVSVARVELYLGRVGLPDDLLVRITSDNGNKPRNTDLARQTLVVEAVPTSPGWVMVTFDNPAEVNNGKYWIVLDGDTGTSSKYYTWWHDNNGGAGVATSNWASISASWGTAGIVGDFATRVWLAPENHEGNKAEDMIVAGRLKANLAIDNTAGGMPCPQAGNVDCVDSSAAALPFPLTDDNIAAWQATAATGGTCSTTSSPACNSTGDLVLNTGDEIEIGPMVIPGRLALAGNSKLIVNGPLWVQERFTMDNSSIIELGESYTAGVSEVIVVGDGDEDGDVSLGNDAAFIGAGAGSSILVISTKNDTDNYSITINNNAGGDVLYFAPNTCIRMSNSGEAKALVGYCVKLDNYGAINYDSLLNKFSTSSNFTGVTYHISEWQEIP